MRKESDELIEHTTNVNRKKESDELIIEHTVKGNEKIVWRVKQGWAENLTFNLQFYLGRKRARHITRKHLQLATDLLQTLQQNVPDSDLQRLVRTQLLNIQKSISPRGWNFQTSYLYSLTQFVDALLKLTNHHADKLLEREDHYRDSFEKKNTDLLEQVKVLQNQLKVKEDIISAGLKKQEELTTTVAKLRLQVETLTTKQESLLRELALERSALQISTDESQTRGNELIKLNALTTQLEEDKNKLIKEIHELNKLKKVEPVKTESISSSLKKKNQELNNRCYEMEQKLKLYDSEHIEKVLAESKQIKEENERLATQVVRLNEQALEQNKKIEMQITKIEEIEQKIIAQASDLSSMATELQKTKTEGENLKTENQNLTAIIVKIKLWIYKIFGQFGTGTKEDTWDLIQKDCYTFNETQITAIKKIAIAPRIHLSTSQINDYVNQSVFKIQNEAIESEDKKGDKTEKLINNLSETVTSTASTVKNWFVKK